jgi:hypothetical protein
VPVVNFFLGTHHPNWLRDPRFTDVPLFVSHRSLRRYKKLPRAVGSWALDSGGFTELSMHGRWTLPAAEYARAVNRYADEVGGLAWASPQDWMCEDKMLEKTGLSVDEHQRRTVDSVQELRALGVPVIPVLQGSAWRDYWKHVEDYDRAGVDLRREPVVGVGTMCRRQETGGAAELMHGLARYGIRPHGFGFKTTGLRASADVLASADSLAWSYGARYAAPLPECVGRHKSCANCQLWALRWRDTLLRSISRRSWFQPSLFAEAM